MDTRLYLRLLVFLSLLLWVATARGFAPADPVPLWPGPTAPNETAGAFGPEVRRQDGAQTGCGAARTAPCDLVTNVTEPTLTPFLVSRNNSGGNDGGVSAVVVAPGGGYHILAIDKEGADVCRMYNGLGVSCFLLKYRVPARPDRQGLPHWWAPLQDAQRAMSMVRAGAKSGRWETFSSSSSLLSSSRVSGGLGAAKIDPDKIGFAGFSAGGHLTAHVSTAWRAPRSYAPVDADDSESPRPDFSIFGYPWMLLPDNMPPAWGAAYRLADEFTGPQRAPDKDHPVSLFVHNDDDPVAPVQGTLAYAQKLKAVGAPTSFVRVSPTGGHGFGLCQNGFSQGYEEGCDWPKAAQRFLQVHGLAPGVPHVAPGAPGPAWKDMLTQGCGGRAGKE